MGKKFILIIIVLLLFYSQAKSQCNVTAMADTIEICIGDSVNIWGVGGCGMLMSNNFNAGNPGQGWTATQGVSFTNPCGPGPDLIHLWMGNNVPIPRTLTTVGFDVTTACEISFWLKFGIQSQPSPCEGPDLANEGVSLQYSTNGGTTWTDIAYFRPDGQIMPSYPNTTGFTNVGAGTTTQFTTWGHYSFPIPAGATSTNTMFRWRQHDYSSQVYDHWGIDVVEILCPGTTQVLWNTGQTTLDTFAVSPPVTTTYIVTVFDTINNLSDTDSITIIVHDIPPPPTAIGDTVFCGDPATVSASGSTGVYEWFSDPWGNNSLGMGNPFTINSVVSDSTFYVGATNGTCVSQLVPVHITVIPLDDPLANGTVVFCGDSATITASGSNGNFEWYSDPLGNNVIGNGTSFTTGPLSNDTILYVAATSTTGAPISYNFTNCGAIGRIGPNQTQVNNSYAGTTLENMVTVIGSGIQEWIAPTTGTYRIEAAGAQGSSATGTTGGLGAYMSGDFDLTQGDVIRVLVGQNAPNTPGRENLSSSGGGGSFVTRSPHNSNASILVIAGGGGGTGNERPNTSNGSILTNGQTGSHGTGGINGNGGTAGITTAGAGAGFFTDGVGGGGAGFAYITGGQGGIVQNTYSVNGGGFGGGGSVTSGGNSRYGGGGGYSGGSGSSNLSGATTGLWGGGGGSYNTGTNQDNQAGYNYGHGYVNISTTGSGLCKSNIIPVHITVIPIDDPTVNSPIHICVSDSATLTASGSSGNYNWYDDPSGTNLVGTGSSFTTPILNTTTTYYVEAVSGVSTTPQQHNFSHCGATGQHGPTQTQVNTAYQGTSLDGQVTINTQGIQEWTVPTTDTYHITAVGAQGYGSFGGRGAMMSGEFSLTAGTTLKILVGQQGAPPVSSSNQYGGGGGSFVTHANNTPLIIAGGGGGSWGTGFNVNADGNITQNGSPGTNGSNNGVGGTAGNGGGTASSADGGGGLLGNGIGTASGLAFVNGGIGGLNRGHGGFGGGGGTSSWDNRRGGGGGGYSGGGGSHYSSSSAGNPIGGGGGSYNVGTNQQNTPGFNTGDGYVIIATQSSSSVCKSNLIPVTVVVDPMPTITASSNPVAICVGNQASISATSDVTGTNYTWGQGLGAGQTHSVSPQTTTTYTVTGTTTSGCSGTGFVTVAVNPNPVITASASALQICEGDSTTLNVTSNITGTTFNWSGLGTGTSHLVSPNATTTYTVIGTTANGCSDTTSITITVYPNPIITISPTNPAVCLGHSTTITASGGNSYTWSGGLGTGASQTVSPTTQTTYTVTGTDGNGCSGTASVTVDVSPDANITVTPAAPSICNGNSVNITAGGGSTYTWSNNLGTGATHNVSPTSTTTYSVTGTDANGCTGTTSVQVTVNQNPSITINPNTPSICNGDSINITASGANTYQWSSGLGAGASHNVSPTTTTTYTVTGTDGNGCSGTNSVLVTINPNPTITISPTNPAVCLGHSTTITASGGNSYTWSGGLGTGASQTVSPTTQTTYTVTGTDGNGCSGTASVTVDVSPDANITVTPAAPSICNGNSVNITAGGGSTYTWSNNLGTGATHNVSPTSTTTYSVTGTDANGCTGTTSVQVTVNQNPSITINPNTPSICNGDSINITASGANTYQWSSGLGAGASHNVSPTATTTYTVTGTDGNGCSGTNSVLVTINPNPTITISPTNPAVCLGHSTTITASGGNSYTWSGGLGTGASQTVSPTTQTTYTVTGTDGNSCLGTASVTVDINDSLTVSVTPSNASICEGDDILLTANSNGVNPQFIWSSGQTSASVVQSPTTTTQYDVTATDNLGCTGVAHATVTVNQAPYVDFEGMPLSGCTPISVSFINLSDSGAVHWNFGDGNSSNLNNPSHTYTNSGNYSVTLTVSNGGCENSLTLPGYVQARPNPIAGFHPSSTMLSEGSSTVFFSDESIGATSWYWDFGSNTANGWSTQQNPEYTYGDNGIYIVWQYVENQWGCRDSTSREIIVNSIATLYIPNAFSPNGDGINDLFMPFGENVFPDKYQMIILDRWGKQLFQTDNINTPWDGKAHAEGDVVKEGVYVYVIRITINGVEKVYEGTVLLIK
jgi:gliding motility-associated-like protein